jgi:hypothetical protein
MPVHRGDSGPLAADRLVTWHHTVETASPGRVCAEPGCDTRLSIYNTGDRCARHERFVSIVVRPSPTPRGHLDPVTSS